jgi:hypothetical protein
MCLRVDYDRQVTYFTYTVKRVCIILRMVIIYGTLFKKVVIAEVSTFHHYVHSILQLMILKILKKVLGDAGVF